MRRTGYWPTGWPAAGGAGHQPKTAPHGGPDLAPTDHLEVTSRVTRGRPVMFVQRAPGELYLYGTTDRGGADATGWLERVDPASVRPLDRSPDLASGGHGWCGGVVVHGNGDLYVAVGAMLHRLDARCRLLASAELPVAGANDGIAVLDDGSIVVKDLRLGPEPSTLTVVDPDLKVVASAEIPEPSMGGLVAVPGQDPDLGPAGNGGPLGGDGAGRDGGDVVLVAGSSRVFRYRWDGRRLTRDRDWQPVYREADRGGMAIGLTVSDGRVWLLDNGDVPDVHRRFGSGSPTDGGDGAAGRIPDDESVARIASLYPARSGTGPAHGQADAEVAGPAPAWHEPVRLVGIGLDQVAQITVVQPTEMPTGWVMAGPLVHDGVAVAWDTGNGGVAAFDVAGYSPEMLWFQPFRTSMHPLLFPATGELVVNDVRFLSDVETSDDLVVLDLRTGRMKARVPTGADRFDGMFLTPGWDRDLYYCTVDRVARIRAVSLL